MYVQPVPAIFSVSIWHLSLWVNSWYICIKIISLYLSYYNSSLQFFISSLQFFISSLEFLSLCFNYYISLLQFLHLSASVNMASLQLLHLSTSTITQDIPMPFHNHLYIFHSSKYKRIKITYCGCLHRLLFTFTHHLWHFQV